MSSFHLVLDLTRSSKDAGRTFDSLRTQSNSDWKLSVLFSDAEGERDALHLASVDARCIAMRAGSGTGVCKWSAVVEQSEAEFLAFTGPGDVFDSDILTAVEAAFRTEVGSDWLVTRWTDAPFGGWWFDPGLRELGAAMMLLGATPPESAVFARTRFWRRVCNRWKRAAEMPHRTAAFGMMALESTPLRLEAVTVAVASVAPAIDAGHMAECIAEVAVVDPAYVGRLTVDMARLASGLAVGHECMIEAVEGFRSMFGAPGPADEPGAWWLSTLRFNNTLIARGGRPVWIWGAGGRGKEALAWLLQRGLPVAGFLDSDIARTGGIVEGLHVQHGPSLLGEIGKTPAHAPLIIVASMYAAQIASTLESHGWREGERFAIFTPRSGAR